jgi:hypothetical protein
MFSELNGSQQISTKQIFWSPGIVTIAALIVTCSHGSGHAGLILDTSQHAEHEKTTHVMRRLHACDLA